MATDTNTADEKLVSTASHGLDLTLNDLLHVCIALGLHQVLALSHPGAAAALLFGFLDYNGRLNCDHVHQLVESKQLVASLYHEGINVHLRILTVIMQEDESSVARMEQRAVRSSHGLEDDIIADVVLEQTVLGDGLF